MGHFAVILPAAGRSSRFGDPKQKKTFAELDGRAVWLRAIEPFLNRSDVVGHAVTGQAKLRHPTRRQETWICGTMRRMTRDAAFRLDRRMLVNKRTLLVGVTLDAGCIRTCRKSCLFQLETTVWIVAVGALHRSFEHLVVEGHIELVFDFRVTTQAKLRLVQFQQLNRRESRFLSVTR